MEFLDSTQFWAILGAVAIGAYLFGRMSGGGSPEDRAERQMRRRQEAEAAFANMPPAAQQEIDQLLTQGKTVEAVKRFRDETGSGLKEAKDAIDVRRATMSGV